MLSQRVESLGLDTWLFYSIIIPEAIYYCVKNHPQTCWLKAVNFFFFFFNHSSAVQAELSRVILLLILTIVTHVDSSSLLVSGGLCLAVKHWDSWAFLSGPHPLMWLASPMTSSSSRVTNFLEDRSGLLRAYTQNFLSLRPRTDTASLCHSELGKVSHRVTSCSNRKDWKRTNARRCGLLGTSSIIAVLIIFSIGTTTLKANVSSVPYTFTLF